MAKAKTKKAKAANAPKMEIWEVAKDALDDMANEIVEGINSTVSAFQVLKATKLIPFILNIIQVERMGDLGGTVEVYLKSQGFIDTTDMDEDEKRDIPISLKSVKHYHGKAAIWLKAGTPRAAIEKMTLTSLVNGASKVKHNMWRGKPRKPFLDAATSHASGKFRDDCASQNGKVPVWGGKAPKKNNKGTGAEGSKTMAASEPQIHAWIKAQKGDNAVKILSAMRKKISAAIMERKRDAAKKAKAAVAKQDVA